MVMSLSINGSSSSGLNAMSQSQRALQLAMARLASGQRITSGADDPAGLIIAKQLEAMLSGMDQASANTDTAVSLLQTADGGLEQTQGILAQQRTLALQAANSATMDDQQLAAINTQYQALNQALDLVASSTTFAKKPLLDGSFTKQSMQIGASAGDTVSVDIASTVTGSSAGYSSHGLGLSGLDISNTSDALARLDAASSAVGQQRGTLGALQANALESNARSLAIGRENLASAISTIADADIAQEAAALTSNQIKLQSGIAMQAQAHQHAGRVMQLLGM